MDQRLLTIQDISCVGQCSLTVALPVISACGIETAVLPSSVLSNHTAFKSWTFNDLTFDMENILSQWKKENVTFSAFYTGYVSEAQIPIIKKIIKECPINFEIYKNIYFSMIQDCLENGCLKHKNL